MMEEQKDAAKIAELTKASVEICEILHRCSDVDMVFQSLASATAISLCSLTSSGEDASNLFVVFQEAVNEAVKNAERAGMTTWGGSRH